MYSGMTESKIFKDFVLENISSTTSTTASPDASSTTSDSPTPTNSIREKNWVNHYQNIGSGVCEEEKLIGTEEEQRQLLGTEEESSDKHSSDGESDTEDIWTITEEQHSYYEKQFKSLQPNADDLLPGTVAKKYFQKSRLNVEELRKIWELADFTQDGALSLQEFKVAMHLVVARRHEVPVPEELPRSLVFSVLCLFSESVNDENTSNPSKGQPWTKFADSPTDSLSSPGPKPVNFDFSRASIEKNPKILHPVALRATPASDTLVDDKIELKKSTTTDQQLTQDPMSLKSIQRPQPKKHTAPGPGAIPPPPHSNLEENSGYSGPASLPVHNNKKDPPPPPPPRPNRTHFRSSSLDLSRLGKNIGHIPSIPPRTSPAVVNSISQSESVVEGHPYFVDFNRSAPHGAFHVYRKMDSKEYQKHTATVNNVTSGNNNTSSSAGIISSCTILEENKPVPTKDSVDECNKYLRTLCRELQDELNVLREKRVALQTQLEKLHSRSPLPVQHSSQDS